MSISETSRTYRNSIFVFFEETSTLLYKMAILIYNTTNSILLVPFSLRSYQNLLSFCVSLLVLANLRVV
jgi:hypothetical protein